MKFQKIALLAVCLSSVPAFSGPAFAASAKVAEIADVSVAISQASLTEDGVLTVVRRSDASEMSQVISAQNLDTALSLSRVLSQTPLTTDHRAIVCMPALGFGGRRVLSVGQYDQTAASFVGAEDHVVLSTAGCWAANYVHPTDASVQQEAVQLETMLVTLANEVVPSTAK